MLAEHPAWETAVATNTAVAAQQVAERIPPTAGAVARVIAFNPGPSTHALVDVPLAEAAGGVAAVVARILYVRGSRAAG